MSSEDPNSKVWPTDLLGNEIRKNGLIVVNFPQSQIICRVGDVRPVSLTDGMEVEGSLTLMMQVPHRGQVPIALVVKEPEEQRIHIAEKMPELVKQ